MKNWYESGHVDTHEVRAGDVEVDFRIFEEVWGGYNVSYLLLCSLLHSNYYLTN